tara:strand:+ start:2347 stop:2694 length:348 start_codon:yes stop_codon:yes gene_type:complete
MEDFLLNIETEFFFLTGTYFENFVGLFIGLFLFSLIIHFLRFENKKQVPNIESSNLSEVGDETLAKMNLSRSLIEMDQKSEAKKLLEEVLNSVDLSEENIKIANSLLEQISDEKS